MGIFHVLSGKVSRVNSLRRIVANDLSIINSTIFPVGTKVFVESAIYELFNPDNNILIKHANDINESDIHLLVCTLVVHYANDFRNNMDMNCISEELECNLGYSKEKSTALMGSLASINETSKSIHPTINLIIQYSHANYHPTLNNKIVTVLMHAHIHTKKEINSALKRAFGK